MRIRIVLKPHMPIPIDYRLGIVSLFKRAFYEFDADYYKKLYESGRKSKPFAFGVYLKNFNIGKDEIETEEVHITVSAHDPFCLVALQNGLVRLNSFNYKDTKFSMLGLDVVPSKEILCEQVVCKTLSPLIIEDKNKKMIDPGTAEFQKEVNYFAGLLLREFADRDLIEPITFIPITLRQIVAKEFSSKAGKYIPLFGYKGDFALKGHPLDLQFFYDSGLGRRRSVGFGLFDVTAV